MAGSVHDVLVRRTLTDIVYQGVPGAFGEEAAIACFGDATSRRCVPTFAQVFAEVAADEQCIGVLPIENALTGSVLETYDLLLANKLTIVGEVLVPIAHCLLVRPGATLDDVTHCYSHPQALAQCAPFLDARGITQRATYNTAGAAQRLSTFDEAGAAAIASARAARLYGLEIAAADIQSRTDNVTRFIALARGSAAFSQPTKASLVFGTANEPGALLAALQIFAARAINLTKIESRPTGHALWEYHFHVDIEHANHGILEPRDLAILLEKLEGVTQLVRLLGAYSAAVTHS